MLTATQQVVQIAVLQASLEDGSTVRHWPSRTDAVKVQRSGKRPFSQRKSHLPLNHPRRRHHDLGRNRKPERLHRFQVNHELEYRGLLDRQMRRYCPLKYPIHIMRGAADKGQSIGAVTEQSACHTPPKPAPMRRARNGLPKGDWGSGLAFMHRAPSGAPETIQMS